jgi:DNA modification methylase
MTMDHNVEYYSPHDLQPYKRNARTHSKVQITQIAKSIEQFGFTAPILIDGNRMILAGHGRVRAAILLGMKTVPCIRIDTLTEAQKRAYILADNKLALNAGWDEDLLASEVAEMLALDVLEFDIDVIGFSVAEIDSLIEGLTPEEAGDPADDVIPTQVPSRCAPGDIWQLGTHRLICGDALDPDVVARLMNGEQARMAFSDPPYNVPIDGHVGNSGKTQHREFAMAAGEMTQAEFVTFLTTALRNLSRHELIFAFKNGKAPHMNTFELGQHGRYRTNVWQYRGVNTRKIGRMDELALHPTVKPVQMIADAIRDVSARGDIVLDLFGGSGSTLIAAAKTGRRAYLCELDPGYCDTILRRWETYAKDEAEPLVCGWPKVVA